MKLFVGLGNPGIKYQNTRHNLGAMVVNEFAKQHSLNFKNQPKLSAQIIQAQQSILAITNEYMNNSGLSVQKIAHYYKIAPKDIYIIHDDLDLEVGDYKIQFDRGPAGHNGVISTITQLGTQAFNRIRIGVDKPTDGTPIENYVLLPFSDTEKPIISETISKIIQGLDNLIS